MECSISSVRPTCYILLTTEFYFQIASSTDFDVIYINPSQFLEYHWTHVLYILSNTKNASSQLKVLLNWSTITTLMFPYIMSSIECISQFLKAKDLEQRTPFDSSSSLNDRCYKLWFESFGKNIYNASVLKSKKRKHISSSQRCHDQSCPFGNHKHVDALLSAVMYSDMSSSLMFMRSFCLQVNELNLTPYPNLP